jgi:hypothetical protein
MRGGPRATARSHPVAVGWAKARSAVPTIFTREQTNGGHAIGRFASARFAHPTAGLNYVHIP